MAVTIKVFFLRKTLSIRMFSVFDGFKEQRNIDAGRFSLLRKCEQTDLFQKPRSSSFV